MATVNSMSSRRRAVVSSDLRRAQETAQCLAAGCGLTVRLDRGLRDRPGALRLVGVGVSGLVAYRQLALDAV